MKINLVRLQANFYTGLAIVLPAVISIAILIWIFGGVASMTDIPVELPLKFIFDNDQLYNSKGTLFWYWRLLGLFIAIILIGMIGALARYYIGKRLITMFHLIMLRIPLLNKIYGAIKQVNDAFTSTKKSSFKQVVLVEFPSPGLYSIGFITGDEHQEVQAKTQIQVISVFVPTTPNPTTGFMLLVPEEKITRLEMPVADGIKYIVSLGSVAPPWPPPALKATGPLPALTSGPTTPDSVDSIAASK